jgi:hypothetical protein
MTIIKTLLKTINLNINKKQTFASQPFPVGVAFYCDEIWFILSATVTLTNLSHCHQVTVTGRPVDTVPGRGAPGSHGTA